MWEQDSVSHCTSFVKVRKLGSHCHHLRLKLRFLHCQHLILIIPPINRFRDQVSESNPTCNAIVVAAIMLSSEMIRTLCLQVFLFRALFRSTCPLLKSMMVIHATSHLGDAFRIRQLLLTSLLLALDRDKWLSSAAMKCLLRAPQ